MLQRSWIRNARICTRLVPVFFVPRENETKLGWNFKKR